MNFEKVFSDTTRWKTAAVLLAVVAVVGFFHNFLIIWLFLSVVAIFAFHEAMSLYSLKEQSWLYVVAGVIWALSFLYPKPEDLIFLGLLVLASFVAYRKTVDQRVLLPFLYPLMPMLFLVSLYHEFGIISFVWLLVVVVSSDGGAYIAGKLMGKTPFSPTSPNKTLEGVVGGVTIAVVLGTIAGLATELELLEVALISLAVSVASVFGDLFESYLKREAGVKDSGNIFPGHGGMLDRVDGYLFAGVVLTLGLRAFS